MAGSGAIRNIWMITREYGNLAGAGGVRDMVRQLSVNLARWSSRSVSVVLPLYGFMDLEGLGFTRVIDPNGGDKQLCYLVDMHFPNKERGEEVSIWRLSEGRVTIYGLESERFSDKNDVYVYTAKDESIESWKKRGDGHHDYFAMNVLLQKGALDLMMLIDDRPEVIHCHDGHTAILPAMIRKLAGYRNYFKKTGAVVTVHNAGYGYHQEIADLEFAHAITGLPWSSINDCLLEERFDPFVSGAKYAVINTVSENYARELQETDADKLTGWLGHFLLEKGILLEGITNGIDPVDYDPTFPDKIGIAAKFDVLKDQVLEGKVQCKKHLLQELDGSHALPLSQAGYLNLEPERPLFTFVGRLNEQKGVDILVQALYQFLGDDELCQAVILGSGDKVLEDKIIQLAELKVYQGRLCFLKGFDPVMANKLFAAGDFFLIPSRFEPCGLTDYIAQLFGNIPIVHHVGGLVKVIDGKSGFGYSDNYPESLAHAMTRANETFADPKKIRRMQRDAREIIEQKYIWSKVIKKYNELYKKAARKYIA